MIKVESKFKDFGIQIPTDISEITSEALDAILTNVVIAKISKEDAELIGMNQMDKIIIDRSTLERGYHLYLKHNVLSPQFVNKYITNDTELTRSITVGTFGQNQGYKKGQKVWFVEFKVIAINDLRAAITDKHKAINPFVYHYAEKAN